MKSSLGLWLFHDLNWCQNRLAILPISLFKTSNTFVYKCQFTSHRDVEDQRLVMVLINTQRLNNRLHSEPQTQCLGESASGSRYLLGPAWFHLSLTLPPGSSHCVTCRTGHTRDCLSFRPPGSVHSSLSWKLMFTFYPRLWAREITGFLAADGDADWRPRESWPKTSTRYRRWKSVNAGCRMSWRSICRTIHHETIVWFAVCQTVRKASLFKT